VLSVNSLNFNENDYRNLLIRGELMEILNLLKLGVFMAYTLAGIAFLFYYILPIILAIIDRHNSHKLMSNQKIVAYKNGDYYENYS